MLKFLSVIKKVSRKEWYLVAPLALFWIVLCFNSKFIIILYPVFVGIGFTLYFREKLSDERKQDFAKSVLKNKTTLNHEEIRDVVHQFRAPLAGLRMACDHIAKNPENSELVLAMVKTIPKQVDGLLTLTTEISRSTKAD